MGELGNGRRVQMGKKGRQKSGVFDGSYKWNYSGNQVLQRAAKNNLQFVRSKHVQGKVTQSPLKIDLLALFSEKIIVNIKLAKKIDQKGVFHKLRSKQVQKTFKIPTSTSILYNNNKAMPTQLNTFAFLLLLSLLSLTHTQTPPHIHKLPLQLTSNYVYYADLYFGSNQQNITVLIDTGSRTLAAFCSLCQKGCLPQQEFIVETSDTFMNVSCETVLKLSQDSVGSSALRVCKNICSRIPKGQEYYCKGELNYGSSSLASFLDYFLIHDKVTTQPNGFAVSSSFGCIYAQNNFDTGIWGLSLGPQNQFLDEIHRSDQRKNHTQAAKLFTICTSDNTAVMNIGGIDPTYHVGEGYRMRVNPGLSLWWNIHVQDIGRIIYENGNVTIREQKESFGVHGVILDSGTDFHILPNKILQKIAKIAIQRCSMISGCELTQPYEIFSQVFVIPEPQEYFSGEIIGFQIGGRLLQTPLSNYFWNLGDDVWALAVVSAEQFNFQMSILGSIWMNNFDIVFDRHKFAITVFDVTGCQPSSRRLQQEDEEDGYDLPVERGDRIDGTDAIMRLKIKHQRGIEKMNSEKQQN